jgi:hypothetical protein
MPRQWARVGDASLLSAAPRFFPPRGCINWWLGDVEVSYAGLFGAATTHLDCRLSTKRLCAPDRTPAGSPPGSCPDY